MKDHPILLQSLILGLDVGYVKTDVGITVVANRSVGVSRFWDW